MTLKTSLIIAGDASGGTKALDELLARLEKVSGGAKTADVALADLDGKQAATAASAGQAAGETAKLGEATTTVATGAQAASQALATTSDTQAKVAVTARDAATAQADATTSVGKLAEASDRLATANGAAGATATEAAGKIEAVGSAAATTAANTDQHRASTDQLATAIDTVIASAAEAGTAVGALGTAQADAAATAGDATTATTELGSAATDVATGAREAVDALGAAATAQADIASSAREVAAAEADATGAIGKLAEETGKLADANDAVGGAASDLIEKVGAAGAAQVAAGGQTEEHRAALDTLASSIDDVVGKIAAGADPMETFSELGGGLFTALNDVATAAKGSAEGVAAVGAGGEEASEGIGALSDKADGLGESAGAAAAEMAGLGGIFAGVAGAAVGILASALVEVVAGLLQTEEAAVEARDAVGDLTGYVSGIGTFFDQTTGKIRETNQALVQFAILSRQNKADALRNELIGYARTGQQTRSSSLRDLRPTFIERGMSGLAPRGKVNADVDQALRLPDDAANAQLRIIARSNSTNAAQAASLLEDRAKFQRALGELNRNNAEVRSLRSGQLDGSLRSTPPSAVTSGGGRGGSGGTGPTPEARAAADAQRELARDLGQVIAKYLPAEAAAKEYGDELARINTLAASFDPDKAGSGLSPEQADRARAALIAANDKRMRELALTPEAKAADEARKSIDGVVASLGREIAARQALDPVQRAMIEHQDELAKLSDTERAAYEAKLRSLYAQQEAYGAVADATRDAAEAQRQLRDLALDALDAIALRGEKAGDVLKRLGGFLASAAMEKALFGTGPLAALDRAPATGGGTTPEQAADLIGKASGRHVGDRMDNVFERLIGGANGSKLGSMLGTAGQAFGYYQAGVAVSDAVSDLFGLKKFAGGKLGVLPNLLATMFAPRAQPGGASIGAVGGEAAIGGTVGRDAGGIKTGTGLGGAVADQINQLAERLGGQIGAFSVQIGKYKDDLRVNVDGRALGGVKGSGAVGFGDDEGAAVAYAVAQAVAQGAITGVSDKVAAAIRSSADVEKSLAEAIKVQDLELVIGGIAAEYQKAFRDAEAQGRERLRIATAYGFDVVAVEKKNAEDRAKLAEKVADAQVGSLRNLLSELTAGSLFEGTAIDRLAAINVEIDKAKLDLDADVAGAGDRLAQQLQSRLNVSKEAFGTTDRYAADRTDTLNQARAAIARENARVLAAQTKTSDPALTATNAALDENNDQNAQMLAKQERTIQLLERLISSGATPSGFDLTALARV